MNKEEFIQLFIFGCGIVTGGFIAYDFHVIKKESPYFVVTDMVQCNGNICNAVLEMDDIAILIPFDITKVHVGDKIYLVK